MIIDLSASVAGRALQANCGDCWAPPGFPCSPEGPHLARLTRAYSRGIVTRAELAAVVDALPAIAGSAIVPYELIA